MGNFFLQVQAKRMLWECQIQMLAKPKVLFPFSLLLLGVGLCLDRQVQTP